uniref:Putative secreted protein n=1 Tax=Anopheles marajoara TaxID=58244 RepID=A0A2M4C9W0_9DIPT
MLNFISSILLRTLFATIIVRFFHKTYTLNRLFVIDFHLLICALASENGKNRLRKFVSIAFFLTLAKIHSLGTSGRWANMGIFGAFLGFFTSFRHPGKTD